MVTDRLGRTTQKRAWVVRKRVPTLFMRTLTMTWLLSGLRSMLSSVPSATHLYFTWVWPTVIPSLLLKVMVTSGPCCTMVR